MTSKEGSHPRASYFMHTGYLPNPSARHPTLGAIVASELAKADDGATGDRADAFEDIFWALVNSAEFIHRK